MDAREEIRKLFTNKIPSISSVKHAIPIDVAVDVLDEYASPLKERIKELEERWHDDTKLIQSLNDLVHKKESQLKEAELKIKELENKLKNS